MFFISIVFAFPFLGFIETPQIIFYFIFVCIGVGNLSFYAVSQGTRLTWIQKRSIGVLLPVLLMISLQTASLIFFLERLDELNGKINNAYPVLEED